MQTAAESDAPLPRRMASRPVCWMAETIVEGGVVPVMCRSWVERSAEMDRIPGRGFRAAETVSMQELQWRGTAKLV